MGRRSCRRARRPNRSRKGQSRRLRGPSLSPSSAALAAHALELRIVLLPVHEAAARAAALGPVFLTLRLRLELRALAHRALSGFVAGGFVDGHGILRCFWCATGKATQSSIEMAARPF